MRKSCLASVRRHRNWCPAADYVAATLCPRNPVSKHLIFAFAAILLLSGTRSACAFIDPPYLTPEHPAQGEPVFVKIHDGICDGIIGIPGYPQITQNGSAIRIVLWSVSYTDPILCNIPEGTGAYTVGVYPPGSYVVQVDREYFDAVGGIVTETLGVIPFTVRGSMQQPVALPATNVSALGVLAFAVFLAAAYTLRRLPTPRDDGWNVETFCV